LTQLKYWNNGVGGMQNNGISLYLPEIGLIEEAARHCYKHLNSDKTVIYLIGHGAIRDWYCSSYENKTPLPGSVGNIFSKYNQNLSIRQVGQSDLVLAQMRPIYPLDNRDLVVRGAKHAIIFDTSIKEKEAPSIIPALYNFLPNMDCIFWIAVTSDFFGYAHFPIEHIYKKNNLTYSGIDGIIEQISRKDVRETIMNYYDRIGVVNENTKKWLTNNVNITNR